VAVHSYLGIAGATVTPDAIRTLNLKDAVQRIVVASVPRAVRQQQA
jgi:hypothetical protein